MAGAGVEQPARSGAGRRARVSSRRYLRSGVPHRQALSPEARPACLMECRIPKTVLIVIVVAVLGGGAAAAAIPLTTPPQFCAACPTIKPSYDNWMNFSPKEETLAGRYLPAA